MFNRCLKRQLIYITTSKRVCQYLFLSFFDFFNSGIARSFGQLVHFTTFFSFCQYLFLFFYIIKSFTICAKVKNPQAVPPVREAAASRTLFFAKKRKGGQPYYLQIFFLRGTGNTLRNSTTQVQPCQILRTHLACISAPSTDNLTEAARSKLMPMGVPDIM